MNFIELRTKLFRLGIKDSQLAGICGITRQFVHMWWTGQRVMLDKYKVLIMQHTNGYITPNDFFDNNAISTNSSVCQQTKTQ